MSPVHAVTQTQNQTPDIISPHDEQTHSQRTRLLRMRAQIGSLAVSREAAAAAGGSQNIDECVGVCLALSVALN